MKKSILTVAFMLLSQPVLAYDEFAKKIGDLEARADHLSVQSDVLRSTIRRVFSGLKKDKDGTIVGGNFLETRALNSKAASRIVIDADAEYDNAVELLREGRTTLGFGTQQQGETVSKSDRISSSMQALDCVKFSAMLIMRNQNLPEALSLGETVSKECGKIVRLIRKDVVASETTKKKK